MDADKLRKMLARCERDSWRLDELDFSEPPRPMSEEDERAVVQLFTDMEGIERMAAALFREQARRASDPTLTAIFESFVADEIRHAHAAARLASHYDRRKLRDYRRSPSLEAFYGPFVRAVRFLSDDVANLYVTAGELMLDIALLSALDDFVDDASSSKAMKLIHRDESRHIAIDYHMVEYYASDAYARIARDKPALPLRERLEAARIFAEVLYFAQPFFRDVFSRPMAFVDPSGARLKEAFKRFQLLGVKQGDQRPFPRFLLALQRLFNHPLGRRLFGGVLARVAGVDAAFMVRFYDEREAEHAASASYADLAREALGGRAAPH